MRLLWEEIQFERTVSVIITIFPWKFNQNEILWSEFEFFYILSFEIQPDPRLTVRHGGGRMPVRIVMSQTLNLPDEAHLWDTSEVSTMVVTQRGARRSFQKLLASKGVEVVEFDMLNSQDVMEYFHDRGYLSILWECGGTLAASAISSGVIHKVLFFLFLFFH